MTTNAFGEAAAEVVERGIGRRGLLRVAAALGAAAGVGAVAACTPTGRDATPTLSGSTTAPAAGRGEILQPGAGVIAGQHYLGSDPDQVLWGYVPTVHASPVLQMPSGETITIDAVSHEGILEDQGRDPVAWFGERGVREQDILEDAIVIAAGYDRTTRNFAVDGPHVVTGPVFVEGAEPGDVLKIETLDVVPRVPYGVVSSRHGRGSLGVTPDGTPPAGITLAEVMPPTSTDHRSDADPTTWGNVSVFTPIETAGA